MNTLLPRLRRAALRLAAPLLLLGASAAFAAKPIVIIETDIGGDKDDQASFVRLLLHANELDIRSIICDRPANQFNDGSAWNPSPSTIFTGVDMANHYLNAYDQVDENLRLHDPAYPTAATLLGRVRNGTPGNNAGRDHIISIVDGLAAGEVVYYSNWGSLTRENGGLPPLIYSSIERAFDHILATRGSAGLNTFASKIRQVSLDGDGDIRSGHTAVVRALSSHVETGYPTDSQGRRWYHRFQPITQAAGGFSMTSDISDTHGPLAPLYRGAGQKEGDSWSTLYVLPFGMNDLAQPTWGGPAGRYTPRDAGPSLTLGVPFYWNNATDTWNSTTSRDNTAFRFAAAVQNAFRARWDWCYMNFASANHDPVPTMTINGGSAVTAGIRRLSLPAGSNVSLAAAVSDPDSGDSHTYAWTYYREAGTYAGTVTLAAASTANASFFIPTDAVGTQIHVYLAVTDDGSRKGNRVPNLTRFCRAVIDVTSSSLSAPAITTQPVSQTRLVGENVTFTVAASGNPAPAYQWRRNGANISGATSANYTITNLTTAHAGNYTVVASNSQGSATSNAAVLTVNNPPAGGYVTVVESDFTGTSPALNAPWTPTSTLASGLTYSGWTKGSGPLAAAGDDHFAIAFNMPAAEADATLANALATDAYWSVSVGAASGTLDLRSADIGFTVQRLEYHSPRRYAVFTSVGGFTSPAAVFDTGRFTTTTPQVFTFQLPDTSAYGAVSGPVEIRIYGYAGQYYGKDTALSSFELSLLQSAPPSAAWTSQDVGDVGQPGSTSHNPSTGVFTVQASGTDIFAGSDEFRYVTLDGGLVGDGEVVARVASITNTHSWAKAGLMIRDGLANNARNVAVLVSPNNNVSFQNRPTAGAATATTTATGVGAPRWLRLVRSGNNFTGYHSANGSTWTQLGSTVVLTLPANLQIGLCVTSHVDATLTTAVIDNVTVTP